MAGGSAGGRLLDLSPSDFAHVSWRDVFEEAGIQERSKEAKGLMKLDPKCMNLHQMLAGKEWAQQMLQLICGSDNVYSKIYEAVIKLQSGAKIGRVKYEKDLIPPSDFAKSIVPYINDNRFSSSLHVGLQIRAFGQFIDIVRGSEEIEGKYYEVAGSLMQSMSKPLPKEGERCNAFFSKVESIIGASPLYRNRAFSDSTTSVEMGGELYPLVNWEFKNEFSGVTSDPVWKNIGCFINFKAGETYRSPMLLVSVVGTHYLQVFGAAWNKAKVCVDPLSEPVSLLYVRRDPLHGVSKVARVLFAITSTIEELKKYYSDPTSGGHMGPYFMQDQLEYGKTVGDRDWLIEANFIDSREKVCVKFIRSDYGMEAHELLASHGLAPKLMSHQRLPGGWVAVIMEKVRGSCLTHDTQLTEPVKHDLQRAMKLLHNNGYVHGDLRPQNILIVKDSICVVDFDWAGVCDTARYPVELSKNCEWHPDVECGGIIKKEHDKYQIDRIIETLTS